MKHHSGILLATLVSIALMQLFCAQRELKYTCETLAGELKNEAALLTMSNERTRREVKKTAELATRLKVLTAEQTRSIDNGSGPATLF